MVDGLLVGGWWFVVGRWWLAVRATMIALSLATVTANAQTPAPGKTEGPSFVPPGKEDSVQRVANLIAKAPGPYKQIALGVWETTYKGKNLPVIRVRVAAAEDGVFFIAPLFPRDKLALSQAFLLRIAEFNAEYDYVKLALDKTSLNIRLDTHAALLDQATFAALEGQTALGADEAYVIIRNMLPLTTP